MLGFRGHYSTRSRCYSTTLTALRQARRDWRDLRLLAAVGHTANGGVFRHEEMVVLDECDQESILVVGQWQYIGRGHSPGEAIYARTIAHDLAENRRIRRQIRSDDEFLGD